MVVFFGMLLWCYDAMVVYMVVWVCVFFFHIVCFKNFEGHVKKGDPMDDNFNPQIGNLIYSPRIVGFLRGGVQGGG